MIELLEARYGKERALAMSYWREAVWRMAKFTPTDAQRRILDDNVRVKLVAGGVRAGKSISLSRSCDYFTCVDKGLIWIIAPDYTQAENEFDYMIAPYEENDMCEYVKRPSGRSWEAQIIGGAKIETLSSYELRKIAGKAPDAIMVVEAGQHQDGILAKVLERALEKNAPITLSGTFEETLSWYPDTFILWQQDNDLGARSYSLPTWSNTVIFPNGKNDPRFVEFRNSIPEDLYLERIEAVPYKPSGLVFRHDIREEHFVPVKYNPDLPLEVAIDPATHTYALLFIQWDGERVYVVDEIYLHGVITQDFIPRFLSHPLAKYVTGGVIDVAARQRHANYSVLSLWYNQTRISLRSRKVDIIRGIDAVKLRSRPGKDGLPNLLFSDKLPTGRDENGKATGIGAEVYMYSWGRSRTIETQQTPVDAFNDGLKALGYWLIDRYGDDVMRMALSHYEGTQKAYPWTQQL